MPYRIIQLENGFIYHIYNRGVAKLAIFEQSEDYKRFIKTLNYYQYDGPKPKFSHFPRFQKTFKLNYSNKIVEIHAYCLMPNHFHLLVKQIRDGGITEFVSKLSNSYTKYYNTKYKRVGPLLQGEFKAVLVESDEQLLHLSRYIHLNPLVSSLVKNLNQYPWSSYHEYIKGRTGICSKDTILPFFKSPKEYEKFVLDHADYAKQLYFIKHQLLEESP